MYKSNIFSINILKSYFFQINSPSDCKLLNRSTPWYLREYLDFSLSDIILSFFFYLLYLLSFLDYDCIIWDPSTPTLAGMIKRLKCKFIRHVSFKFNIAHPIHNNSPALLAPDLPNLADHRPISNLLFSFNFFSCIFDSPQHLSLININPLAYYRVFCLLCHFSFVFLLHSWCPSDPHELQKKLLIFFSYLNIASVLRLPENS